MINKKTFYSYFSKTCSLLVISYIALSFSGCNAFQKEEAAMAPPLIKSADVKIKKEKAKKGNISEFINVTAHFVPENQVECYFKERGGFIKKLYFELGQPVKKGDVLAELDTDELKVKLKQQEIRFKKFKLHYDSIVNDPKSSELDKKNAELDLELEQLELDGIRDQLEKMTLKAPCNGIVTYKSEIPIGDMIHAYNLVYMISNSNNMVLEFQVEDASKLKVGMEATAKVLDKDYKGKIVSIYDRKQFQDENRAGSQNSTSIARVKLDQTPPNIRFGFSSQVSVNVSTKENVIIVPKTAIKYFDKTPYVKIMDGDKKTEKFVTLGIQNNDEVEIIDGVKEGEEVVVN